jgi:hypothetical protein
MWILATFLRYMLPPSSRSQCVSWVTAYIRPRRICASQSGGYEGFIFYDITLCGSLKVNRRFGGTHVASKRTIRRYIPEERTLHIRSCFEIQRGGEGRENGDWSVVWANTLNLLSTWRRDRSGTWDFGKVAHTRAGSTRFPFRRPYWPRQAPIFLSLPLPRCFSKQDPVYTQEFILKMEASRTSETLAITSPRSTRWSNSRTELTSIFQFLLKIGQK